MNYRLRLASLSICAVLGLASAARVDAQTKVMLVGDSLTAFPYYRNQFKQRVAADQIPVTMVGPRTDAVGTHAGFSGRGISAFTNAETTTNINGQVENTSMSGLLTNYQPDVVLLMIGTNNMNHGLGVSQSNPPRYPASGSTVVGAEYADPINGSYLNGMGAHSSNPTYGTGFLKGEVSTLINIVLNSSATRKLVMGKIPPVGFGGPGSATDPYTSGTTTRLIKDFNDNAVERIREYNAYIDELYHALPSDKKSRMRVIDNFTGIDRSYQTGATLTDFGTVARQGTDWVHPQVGAAAWTLMGDNFYTGYTSAIAVPEPSALALLGLAATTALRRRR